MTGPTELISAVSDADIDWACHLMKLKPLDIARRDFLKSLKTVDVSACPGSGKTTLVVAKLAILARKWSSSTRGICVLSHTNVARMEIESRLGDTDVGRRLLNYPHFIDTIHGFVNRFLAIPWIRSAGYPVAAIDNDLTTRVRRRHLGEKNYRRLSSFLENKFKTFDGLRISTADLKKPLAGDSFPAGSHTEMYKLAESALRHAAENGYFCFDEIFILGEALLTQQPTLPAILAQRFPFVLVDEMQDTSEQQSDILRRLFSRDSRFVCVQRVGDPNQAIFDGGVEPLVDAFPDPLRCLSISDSFRFDSTIASLADPFAKTPIQPSGLKGMRTAHVHSSGLPHTIFVFPDDDASGVLDAFGSHAIASLPPPLIGTSAITAVGAVHRDFDDVTPGHAHYPKTVAHYWPGYQSHLARQSYRPRTLAECILTAQAISRSEPLYRCVDCVASGVAHLANLIAGATHLKGHSRQHLHIEQRLCDSETAKIIYRDILVRFLIDRETLTRERWTALRPSLKILGAVLGGGSAVSPAADEFLVWHNPSGSLSHGTEEQPNPGPRNIYRYSKGDVCIDIRLCSIHLAKGQTHLATLVLETFNRSHFLHSLMPWILGKNRNGAKCTSDNASRRLLQIYVAMTRPTHLLCLALRRASLGAGRTYKANTESLIRQGWNIQEIPRGGAPDF
jgi:DNA helicase-2/ATP-dependent DNA helicase PcrA